MERGTGPPGHVGAGVTSSIWRERSGVGGGSAPAALGWTLGELPAGGALRAEAVLARGRSVPERPEGSPGARFDSDLSVPVRHRHRSGVHRGPLLDGYTSERCDSYRWTPGGDIRAAELDCTKRVHPQPWKTGDGGPKSWDQQQQVPSPQPAPGRLPLLRMVGFVFTGAGRRRSAV